MGKKAKQVGPCHPGQHQAGDGCERCDQEDRLALAWFYLDGRAWAARSVRTYRRRPMVVESESNPWTSC